MHAKLLLNQHFSFDDLVITNAPNSLVLDGATKEKLAGIWQQVEADAQAAGKKVWDGLTYRMNQFSVQDSKLHLELAEMPFSMRRSLETLQEKEGENEAWMPNGVAVSPLVQTCDGKFLFGKLSGTTMSTRVYGTFGGIVDRHIGSGEELWAMFLTEMHEEANIQERDVVQKSIEGIVRSKRGVAIIVAHVQIALSAEEATCKFAEREDDEMSEMIAVDVQEIESHPIFSDYTETWGRIVTRITTK